MAYMMVTTPSTMKNAISTKVSDNDPEIGQSSNTTPAPMATTAETSDHKKPGALRIQNVVIRPTMPLIKNSQPITSVNASVAICGTAMAATPRIDSTMPSNRNSFQCS